MNISRRNLRLKEITDIINAMPVRSQAEMLKILQVRGFVVTQASLSRDLKALGVKKSKSAHDEGCYVMADHLPAASSEEYPRASSAGILDFALSGNIAVLKTRNGYAGGIAFDIDQLNSPVICGTIAGGDTVMAVIAENVPRESVIDFFAGILPSNVIASYLSKSPDLPSTSRS